MVFVFHAHVAENRPRDGYVWYNIFEGVRVFDTHQFIFSSVFRVLMGFGCGASNPSISELSCTPLQLGTNGSIFRFIEDVGRHDLSLLPVFVKATR